MNLRDLKYLIALSEYRHFGKAAQACFVSQPALSMQIKKLEDTLGVQLLERTNKSVLFTEVGQAVVQRAHHIWVQVEEIKEIAKQTKDPECGEMHLGIFPTLAPYLLPHLFPKIIEYFPRLETYLIEAKTDELLAKLKQGKLDAALLALPTSADFTTAIPLFQEEFYLAAGERHPFAQKKHVLISDLQNHSLLLLEEGHCLRKQALSLCQQNNHTPETKSFYATSLETLRHMVAAHRGITLIPALSRQSQDGITYIPFEQSCKPSRTIGLVWRNTSARSALFHKMATQIKVLLANKPGIVIQNGKAYDQAELCTTA